MRRHYTSISEMVAEDLREMILRGEMAPGKILRLDELADQFGISRTPIRDAFKKLSSLGFLELKAHKEARVMPLTIEEAEDLYWMRSRLESLATALAIPRLTPDTLDALRGYVDEMFRQAYNRDLKLVSDLNLNFHLTLYAACGRGLLLNTIKNLWSQADRYRRAYINYLDVADRTNKEHMAILQACQDGDSSKAERLMSEHILLVGRALVEHIRSSTPER